MKIKIICILVMMLLIITAIPSISSSINKKVNFKDTQNYEFIPGEFIVKFTKGTKISDSAIINLNERNQVRSIKKVFRNAENTILDNIYLLTVPQDSDILSIVNDYGNLPEVVYAEPNGIRYLCSVPNDEYFDLQWALNNTGQTGGTPDADIDAPEAWNIETGNENIVIAIIDTGVDWDHPDLAANIWSNADEILDDNDTDGNGFIDDIRGWDFLNDINNPMDNHGHGTNCAGIASAVTDNAIGVAGVCWNCKIMPIKVIDPPYYGTIEDFAQCIIYAADNGADIISMSYGDYTYYQIEADALNYAYSHGVVSVAAAGNDDTDEKLYPAGYDNVIAVSATNDYDEKLFNSNYGSWVDVAAPGENIYTTNLDDDYNYLSYTSAATPHVAGLAGLILSKNPSYSNEKIRSIIRANVDPYDSDVYIGTGRINAYEALNEFNSAPPNTPVIDGPTSGKPGNPYTYTFTSTDPDGDQVSYYIKWDDGSTTDWTTFQASGPPGYNESHTWDEQGTYIIKAKVKDVNGAMSDWGTLEITIPRDKSLNFNFDLLEWLFERFPNAFPTLKQLLGL